MIIGLCGNKQVGKSTAADMIKIYLASHGIKSYIYAFADKLRACLYLITGKLAVFSTDESVKNSKSNIKKNEYEFYTYRELLQIFGTEVGRVISPNIWVDALLRNYSEEEIWIIPDVRFKNEVDAIKDKKGILIKITRDLNNEDSHASEHGLDDYNEYDYVIDNNGDIATLSNKINDLIKKLI